MSSIKTAIGVASLFAALI